MSLRNIFYLMAVAASLVMLGCSENKKTLFTLIDNEESGLKFENFVPETDSFNILTYEYIYNGGGVAVADFNNDNLTDVFFCGNRVANALFLNRGDLKFENVSSKTMLATPGRWNSGASIVDINDDGLMDIYICATAQPDSVNRRNMLFVNQGLDSDGIPSFKDMAKEYHVDFSGYSTMAAFFDYDLDGDLDLYILTNVKVNNVPTNYREKVMDGSSPNNDKFFINNGDRTFSDYTMQAGIKEEGFGLGLAVADFNKDGWPDIYVSNDYLSNDVFYLNQRNGTFRNVTTEFIGHQSQFSMGNDAADFNNDGLMDIITLDMLPENNFRKKTTISNKSYQTYINNETFKYQYQYVRNMLHLNNDASKGFKFSEIGEFAGVYQTEWSWSPLFADFDNDGWKDLLITNGFPKDITDKDFANFRANMGKIASVRMLVDSIPVVKIPNYAYKNNGDLTFKDVSDEWGLSTPSFSNAAAFADFDNDGDLDYVINNLNESAFLYKNNLIENDGATVKKTNFIDIQLQGNSGNRMAIGAEVTLYCGSNLQMHQVEPYRGFLSSVESNAHFGVGAVTLIDSVIVRWPDQKKVVFKGVKANQKLKIKYGDGQEWHEPKASSQPVLTQSTQFGLDFRHQEEDVNDYVIQRTLPHKFSQAGPGIAVGDLNGDKLDDIVIGGSVGHEPTIYYKQTSGDGYIKKMISVRGKSSEDEGILLWDADNDNDLDIYLSEGSYELTQTVDIFNDWLLINDGNGNFISTKLDETTALGSCVRAADFDQDGDLDLFVGGRFEPGKYPTSPESYLFRNENGKLIKASGLLGAQGGKIGMVTDALWSDFNHDGKADLIVTQELGAVNFFRNDGSKFTKEDKTGIEGQIGFWNSIAGGDFDSDGDVDYVVGNLGWNNNWKVSEQTPLTIFAKDFDGNGSIDPVVACYMQTSMSDHTKHLFPVHFWDELNSQSPLFRRKFNLYRQYGNATIDKLFKPGELAGANVIKVNNVTTSWVENVGNGKFILHPLPDRVQFAPINGILVMDINQDSELDIVMVGNDYGNEVFAGRYDAFNGAVLIGNGKGGFKFLSPVESGFYVPGDAKALAMIDHPNGLLLAATQNRDSLKVFQMTKKYPLLKAEPADFLYDLVFENGKKRRGEFYFGSGYLSQSSRFLQIPPAIVEIVITDFKGNRRSSKFPATTNGAR